MDFRDLFRNFLGINRRIEPPEVGRNAEGRRNENEESYRRQDNDDNANRNHWTHRDNGRGRDFIFGEMLSSMEDMFKDMEQSFSEIDSFFQDFGNSPFGFGNFVPLNPGQENSFNGNLPSLPSPQEKNDENVRNLVLKEPEKVPAINKSERMDRDLDDLLSKSELPLTELPEAPTSNAPFRRGEGFGQLVQRPKGNFQSSFERVYSTHSFKNGRWEGKTVRENKDGKEITTYIKNANGEQEETTEFIPNTSTSFNNDGVGGTMLPSENTPLHNNYNPFQIFERLFKPRL